MILCQFSNFFTTAILILPIFENVTELPLNKDMTFSINVLEFLLFCGIKRACGHWLKHKWGNNQYVFEAYYTAGNVYRLSQMFIWFLIVGVIDVKTAPAAAL